MATRLVSPTGAMASAFDFYVGGIKRLRVRVSRGVFDHVHLDFLFVAIVFFTRIHSSANVKYEYSSVSVSTVPC